MTSGSGLRPIRTEDKEQAIADWWIELSDKGLGCKKLIELQDFEIRRPNCSRSFSAKQARNPVEMLLSE